jgi:hypothetical protein
MVAMSPRAEGFFPNMFDFLKFETGLSSGEGSPVEESSPFDGSGMVVAPETGIPISQTDGAGDSTQRHESLPSDSISNFGQH